MGVDIRVVDRSSYTFSSTYTEMARLAARVTLVSIAIATIIIINARIAIRELSSVSSMIS